MTNRDPQTVAQGLTPKLAEAVGKLSGVWSTCAEAGVTGTAATLLCTKQPILAERRWTTWSADWRAGIRGGEGYEYRLNAAGLAVRALLEKDTAR